MALAQENFRWRYDDGSETTASWIAAQDTDITLRPRGILRLRFRLLDTGGTTLGKGSLFVSRNGGAYERVSTSSNFVRACPSAVLSSEVPTTEQLTGVETGYVASEVSFDGQTGEVVFAAGNSSDLEYVFRLLGNVRHSDTYDFRVYDNDDPIGTYTRTPRLSVLKSVFTDW